MPRVGKNIWILVTTCLLASLIVFWVFFDENANNDKIDYKDIELDYVEIVDTPQERAQGLMFRSKLCKRCGMLFVFEDEDFRSFWMKDTPISLDMIFIDSDWKVVTIYKNTIPLKEYPTYKSSVPAKYVLEVNAGFCDENNLNLGDYIEVESFF